MQEIFKGSYPDSTSLNYWVYNKVRIEHTQEGNAYSIAAGGYMSQFVNCGFLATEVGINIRYHNPGMNTIPVEILLPSENNQEAYRMLLYLSPTNSYETLQFNIPLNSIDIDTASIEIKIPMNSTNIYITRLEVTAEVSSDNTVSDYQDFSKYAILYGLEADMPNLEVIKYDSNLS